MAKTRLKEMPVQIVEAFWNDSDSGRYIGKQGTITNLEMKDPGDFKTVTIAGKQINFHVTELKVVK